MNWIKLDNGEYLLRDYGKYESGLVLISDTPELPWKEILPSMVNLEQGNLSQIRGSYYRSRAGNDCFRIDPNGRDVLLCDSWGGPNYYGGELKKLPNSKYFRRSQSNGGGLGNDYCIVPFGAVQCVSPMDDLISRDDSELVQEIQVSSSGEIIDNTDLYPEWVKIRDTIFLTGSVPTKKELKQFISSLKSFLESNEDRLV